MAHRARHRVDRPGSPSVRWTVLLAVVIGWLGSAPAAGPSAADPFFSRWETITEKDGLPSDKVFAVLVDGPTVWAGTDAGLAMIRDREVVRVFGASDGLPFRVITALASDPRSGDLWVGTMGGLARLSAGRIDAFDQLDSGLANNVVYGVAVDGADVWVATAAGLSRYDTRSKSWEIYDTTNTLMHEPWCYAVTAEAGKVYVAVWGSGVIVRDPSDGRFRAHRDPDGEMEIDLFRDDGLVHDVTSGIAVADGIMWVGTYFGLSRYDGRRWRSYSRTDSGLASDFINFVKARGEVVWIATDQGLSRFDSETWHTWKPGPDSRWRIEVTTAGGERTERALASAPANNMITGIDVDGDDVWLATSAGLSHGIGKPRVAAGTTSRGDDPKKGDHR